MAIKERYVVVDPETNSIILQKGATERAHPASITKMLNLAMVFEAMSHSKTKLLGTQVKIPEKGIPKALAQFESFKYGESYDIDLLLAASGNKSEARSTIALAHALSDKNVYGWGGDEVERRTNFLAHTNRRLKEIGLQDTNIRVLTGWKNSRHHTTALDVAIAADYIHSNFPKSAEIAMGQRVSSELTPYTSRNPVHSSRVLQSRPNRALWAKTGYLREHGFSQAVYYEKDGKPLIAVVLGSPTKSSNNSKVFEILTEAYKKFEDPNYKPEKAYEDVKYNPNAPLPTKDSTGQTISIPIPKFRDELVTPYLVNTAPSAPSKKDEDTSSALTTAFSETDPDKAPPKPIDEITELKNTIAKQTATIEELKRTIKQLTGNNEKPTLQSIPETPAIQQKM